MNKFSKKIVALVVSLNAGFAIGVLYLFLKVGSEPTALITAWFTFTTGELWMLTGIKKAKLKKDIHKRLVDIEGGDLNDSNKNQSM